MKIFKLISALTIALSLTLIMPIQMITFAEPTAAQLAESEAIMATVQNRNNQIIAMKLANPNQPITIIEGNEVVYIIAYINFSGAAANETIDGVTFRQAFLDGVVENWRGDKDGIYVHVIAIDMGTRPETLTNQRSLSVMISQGTGISRLEEFRWWTPRTPSSIIMFQGDHRALLGRESRYTLDEFKSVSAHEFGHALGISDTFRLDIVTIMGPHMWSTNATRLDLELALAAHRAGRWQSFDDNRRLIDRYGTIWWWLL